MVVPRLIFPVGPRILFVVSWIFAVAGVVLLSLMQSRDEYWRYCFPGMILYILGVGTVYLVANVIVVGSAPLRDQGSVAGVFNVSLRSRSRPTHFQLHS